MNFQYLDLDVRHFISELFIFIIIIRLLERFVPIFYLTCKNFLCIVKHLYTLYNITKNFVDFQFFFQKSNFVRSKFFKIRSSINFPVGHMKYQKIWARSVQPFCRLLDTNRQAKYMYIDDEYLNLSLTCQTAFPTVLIFENLIVYPTAKHIHILKGL